MAVVRAIPLVALLVIASGCGSSLPNRPAQPVVAEVTIHVPNMT